MKKVKCTSGLTGWQSKLRKVYTSFEEFVSYCASYNIHERLGYSTPLKAWNDNPTIQGSTNPDDLKKVK